LQRVQPSAQDARKRAAVTLDSTRKAATASAGAVDAGRAALAAAQDRVAPLEKQSAAIVLEIQKAQEETTRLDAAASETAFASAANQVLQPLAFVALAAHSLAAQSVVTEKTTLAQTQATLATTRDQCAALSREIDARVHSNSEAAAGAKAAETALATAQSSEDKIAGDIKTANLDLLKWRAAAARVASDPQYVSRKADPK
jgi:hypothetical protein